MKKILFIIVSLFIILPIVKADTWFGFWEKITEMNVTFMKGDKVYSNSPFLFRMEDGKVVYCVKPFTDIGHDAPYVEYLYNDIKFNISDEQLEKIKLIAYYGYNYPGHEDRKWYGITQFLIWKTFDLDDIYFTDARYGNKIDIYQSEINEIENLVEKHNIKPSISSNLEYIGNNQYIEEDLNNVLDNYVISDSNIDSYISNNKLYINTSKDGDYYIEFKRKKDLNNNYILYGLDNYQTLFYPGGIEDLNFKINIEVNTGSITLIKKDSENNSLPDVSLSKAIYSLNRNGNFVDNFVTDESGVAKLSNLPLGEYLIKEEIPSKGYLLDNNVYYVNLIKDKKDVIINSYEDVIKGKVILKKYYKDNDEYKIEDGAIFELYNSSDIKIKEYELINGEICDILPFGNYYLKQIKGKEGYHLINKYDFNINDSNEYLFNLYNDPIESDIIITKYYGEVNNYQLEDNAIFELYDSNNNLLREYQTNNGFIKDRLKFGRYYLKQIKGIDGYKFIDDYYFNVSDNDLYINLYNKKKELLVVNVPNTGIKSKTYYSPMIILFGIILVIISKKVTFQ